MEQKTNGITTIAGAIIVAGLLIAGAIFVTNTKANEKGDSAGSLSNSLLLEIRDNDHILGNKNAPLTLIEYSDYKCGYCKLFHPTVNAILAKYPNDIKFIYRHNPQIPPEAFPSAIASECVASMKGNDSFWNFTDGLFENQSSLGRDLYVSLAEKEGIEKGAFVACLDGGEFEKRVNDDIADAQILGVRGTPYSILVLPNGSSIPFSGALPQATIETLIERALTTK